MVAIAFNIVEHQHRHLRLLQRRIGRDRDDAIVLGMQQRLADCGAIDFELRMRMALEALDDDEIERREFCQHVGQRRLGFLT